MAKLCAGHSLGVCINLGEGKALWRGRGGGEVCLAWGISLGELKGQCRLTFSLHSICVSHSGCLASKGVRVC